MQFKRINIKNFLSIQDIEFNFNFNSGITLIKGRNNDVSCNASNASGKSVLQDAIMFAMFGKPLRNINQDEIINRHAKKNCRVELEFDNIKIIRTLKPNSLTVFVDGKEVSTDASTRESKTILDKYLSVNYETLGNILCFGQHNMVSFFDCPEKDRREIVENLMNLREYNLYEEKTKERLKELKLNVKTETEKFNISEQHYKKQQILLNEQIGKYENWKTQIEKEISDLKENITKCEVKGLKESWEEYNKNQKLIVESNKDLQKLSLEKIEITEKLQELYKLKQKEIETTVPLQEEINKLKDLWIQKQEEKNKKIESLGTLKEQIKKLEKEDSLLKIDDEIVKSVNIYNSKIKEQTSKIELVKNSDLKEDDVCEHCFGEIKLENKEKYIEHLSEHLKTLKDEFSIVKDKEEKEKTRVNDKHKELTKEIGSLNTEFTDKTNEIERNFAQFTDETKIKGGKLKSQIKDILELAEEDYSNNSLVLNKQSKLLEKQIDELEEKIKKCKLVKEPVISLDKLQELELQAEVYKSNIEDKKNSLKTNPFSGIIKDLETSVSTSKSETDVIQKTITSIENLVPYYDFWLTAFGKSGIKSFIVDQIVPVLNQQINYWLGLLYNNNISINFDKYLNAVIQNKASDFDLSFFAGSGGEKRRMDLSVMLAFRQVMKLASGKDPNIIFFDEVVENLDLPGIEAFYKALLEMSQSCHIYIITHNSRLLELLEGHDVRVGIVQFEKEKGITKLIK